MANLKIKVELPEDISKISGFSPEHQLVWTTIRGMSYRHTDRGWVKGTGTGSSKDAAALAMIVLTENKTIPLALQAITEIVKGMESMWASIESAAKGESDKLMGKAAEWLKAYGDLAKTRFSQVDEMIWQGLAHTTDSEGQHVVIAPTGVANEFRVVGQNAKEIHQWFYGVSMPGCSVSRMSYVETHIVDKILELTEGLAPEETTPIGALSGEHFPASAIRSIVSKESVTNSEGKFLGFRLVPKGGEKITAFDYIKSSYESFAAREKFRLPQITPLSNNPDEACYRYLDVSDSAVGTWNVWEDWMNETFELPCAKKTFMAWCGCLLDAKNSGKQSLWLHGHGNDGKSKIANSLLRYLGPGATALNGNSMSNQFGLAKLEGKRLVIVGDAKNKKLLQTEWAHNLTGGDSVDIERKGKNSYSQQLIGKLMVCSNVAPEIRADEQNQVSRLIYVKLKKRSVEDALKKGLMVMVDGEACFVGDNSFQDRLDSQAPAFMRACYELYLQTAPTRSDIPIPRAMRESIEVDAADPEAESMNDLLEEFFEFNPAEQCPVNDVMAVLTENAAAHGLNRSNYLLSNFNTLIANRGARKVQMPPGPDGRRERVWRGMRLRQVEPGL